MNKWIALGVLTLCTALCAQSRFVHTDGQYLVSPDSKRLQLRGTNLGNWLVPEGYMFGLKDGPQSAREIEALFNELIGPVRAEQFWQTYRDAYVSEGEIRFIHQSVLNCAPARRCRDCSSTFSS